MAIMTYTLITRIKDGLIEYENHLIFIMIVIFTSVHFYFIYNNYLMGYKRFIEIWYAILKFIDYSIF